jgi:AraC-like DNA-binding protein
LFAGGQVSVADVVCDAPRGGCGEEEYSDTPEVVLARRGMFIVHRGRRNVVADPMTAVVLDGDYRVSHPCEGGDRCLALRFAPELHEEALGEACILRAPQRLSIASTLDCLQAEEQAMSILACLAGAPPLRASARVERVRELLAARPGERWTLAEIARSVHVSPYHLARQFRSATGQTIVGYLTALRLAVALERLQAGEDNLARLAADVGFASHSHLSERFRSVYGASPSQVRRILKAGRASAN